MKFYKQDKFESYHLYDEYRDKDLVNLKICIKEKIFTLKEVIQIIKSIVDIFEDIEKNGYILGSVNIEDFFINKDNISIIKYKINRRLLYRNDLLDDYIAANILAPEVLNKRYKDINKSTDVYLIGRLFIELFFNNRVKPGSYIEQRYLAYNINYFTSEIIVGIHEFLGKTTNLLNEDRYSSIEECKENLNLILAENEARKSDININKSIKAVCSLKTDPGIGKTKLLKSKGRALEKINEDTVLALKGKNDDRFFFMVADGISNCSYGTGYDASNIVKRVCNLLWMKEEQNIKNKNDIENLFKKIIDISNKTIINYVSKEVEKADLNEVCISSGIMATTFSAGIIFNNRLYYINLGDSPIYILSQNNDLNIISKEDNIGNEVLLKNKSWDNYEKLESKTSLTKYIGGINLEDYNFENQEFNINVKEIGLLDQDIILACSDGLTNYIGDELDIKGIWSIDDNVKKILLEYKNLNDITDILTKHANQNGGGDNISVVLMKFYIN